MLRTSRADSSGLEHLGGSRTTIDLDLFFALFLCFLETLGREWRVPAWGDKRREIRTGVSIPKNNSAMEIAMHGSKDREATGPVFLLFLLFFSLVFIFSRDLVRLGACGVSRQGCPRPSQRTEIYLSSLLCSVFVVPGSKRQEPEMTIWVSLMPETTTSLSQRQTKQRITQVT